MSADVAARKYGGSDSDDWFTVVAFGDDVPVAGVPNYLLEIVPRDFALRVTFFDQTRSPRFVYDFSKIDERLFLKEIVEYTYPDSQKKYQQDESSVVEILTFNPDGIVQQYKDDLSQPTIEKASYRDVDVSSHWEPIPEFGDWESVARFDR